MQQVKQPEEIDLVSPPSSDVGPKLKRRAANAQLFDDSENEADNDSDLDQPVAKRQRALPAAAVQVMFCLKGLCSGSHFLQTLCTSSIACIKALQLAVPTVHMLP